MECYQEDIQVGGKLYRIFIYIEKRMNSRASVSRKGVTIRIPNFLSRSEQEKQIHDFKQWAVKRILKNPERFLPETPVDYQDGSILKIMGKDYFLKISQGNKRKSTMKIHDNGIMISIPGGMVREKQNVLIGKVLSKKLSAYKLPEIGNRVMEINSRYFRKNVTGISIKNNKSTWGSCSPRGEITISSRLLLAPTVILDYVIMHELSHLVVRGHSKRFWSVVEKALPDYKEKRKWLRKNGHSLRF